MNKLGRNPAPHSQDRSTADPLAKRDEDWPATAVAVLAPTAPSAWPPLQAALLERRPIAVSYHGRLRLICPHALGWRNHRALVLAYQIGGQTSTGTLDPDPRKRWRCLYLDEIDHLATDHTATWQTPDNYNPQRPFNAIDQLAVAIGNDTPKPRSARHTTNSPGRAHPTCGT